MASVKSELQERSWSKDGFLISTDPSLIPIPRLIEVFNSEEVYWAKALPGQAMQEMVNNSLSFGMYEQAEPDTATGSAPEPRFLGFARCVTDYVTFAYLTDVWVDPSYQGKGLGRWLVLCIKEVLDSMPHLRRSLLFTGNWQRSVPFYEKLMGMGVIETERGKGLAVMECKGRGHPSYGRDGLGYH